MNEAEEKILSEVLETIPDEKEPVWKSGRFWLSVIGILVMIAADRLNISEETAWQVAGLIAAYILARTVRNTKAR